MNPASTDYPGRMEIEMLHFTVIFIIGGHERSREVVTNNANFARSEIERDYPGAIVIAILPGKVR